MKLRENLKKILSIFGVLAVGIILMIALGSTEKESNKRELKPEV